MSVIQQVLLALNSSGGVATDPSFASVVLLLHFDGTNGQTTTVDSSTSAHAMTRVASTLATAQQKFGTASTQISGTDGWTATDSADWAFGSGAFTIEGFIYIDSAPGASNRSFLHQWGGASDLGWFFGMIGGSIAFYYSTTGTNNPNVGAAWTPTLNTWYHVCVDRDASNVIRVYVDGVVKANATDGSALFNSTRILNFGGSGAFTATSGYYDEWRITKGVARYGGAFTPPSAAFPNS